MAADAPLTSGRRAVPDVYDWLFVTSVVALLVRVMLVPSAIMLNDEYYYAKTAYLWFLDAIQTRQITSLPTRGEAAFPNALFFAVYQLTYYFGENFYVGAKLLNVVLGTGMALMVQRVAAQFVDRRAAMAIAILTLWLPSMTYFAYFVPEPLYELLIWCGLAGFLWHIEQRTIRAAAILGACVGAAFLVKPNAIAVLMAMNVVLLAVLALHGPREGRATRVLIALGALNAAFLVAAYATSVLITGNLRWDPVGKFYQTGLSKLGELDTQQSFIETFTRYSAAYVLAIGFIVGPPLVVLLSTMTRQKERARDTALIATCLIGMAALLAGSAKVATNWERVYENHANIFSTRYVSVFIPLFLIAFVKFLPAVRDRRLPRVCFGVLIAIGVIGLGLVFRHMANTFQMRELMWPRSLHQWGYRTAVATSVAVTLFYAIRRRPGVAVYGAFMTLLALGATFAQVRQDVGLTRDGDAGRYADVARALAVLVPVSEYDHGLIVASKNHIASRFMFQFPGIDALIVREELDAVEPAAMPHGTSWIVYLGERPPLYPGTCILLPAGSYCAVGGAALAALRPAAPGSARP